MKKISGAALFVIIIVITICLGAIYVDNRLKPLCDWLMLFKVIPAIAIIALALITFWPRPQNGGPNN